jgi:hypothetical protein
MGSVQNQLVIKDDIQVQDPRTEPYSALLSTKAVLDGLGGVQQRFRGQGVSISSAALTNQSCSV